MGRNFDSIYFDNGKVLLTKETNLFSNYILKYNLTQSTNLQEVFEDPQILLYPNPANNYIKIQQMTEPFNYTIFSSMGLIVNQGIAYSSEINISNLKMGMYFIKIKNKSYKFLKL